MSGVQQQQYRNDPIPTLRRLLHGVYRLELDNGSIHVRIGPLPGHLAACGVSEGGHLWLFIDREKPGGIGHARELLTAHPELLLRDADEGTVVMTRGTLTAGRDDFAEFILRAED